MMNHFDVRSIMALGFALMVVALWQMTGMSLEMGSRLVIVSGFLQGLGIGFTFVPLSAATFATLAPALRNDGTPIYSLMRNIGSSVGISIVQTLLTRHIAQAHADLAIDISNANPVLSSLPSIMSPAATGGLALLDAQVQRQAAMMSYIFDFRAMMVLAALTMPFLLLIRKPRRAPSGDAAKTAAADAH
jgi:DHA2 family multidrug resistance protein